MNARKIVAFAKMDPNLDGNPKVRRAGRDGREVFLFAIRKNASLDLGGVLPARYLEPWFLADQLMMDEVTARNGVALCVTAGLLHETEGGFSISGWDDEWAKRPLTNGERQERFRQKQNLNNPIEIPVTGSNDNNVTGNASNGSEKIRSEKKKEVRHAPDPCLVLADRLRDLVLEEQPGNQLGKDETWPKTRDAWGLEFDRMIRLDSRTIDRIGIVLDWVFHAQSGDARFVVQSAESLRKKFDRIELAMARPAPARPAYQTQQTEIRVYKRLGEDGHDQGR